MLDESPEDDARTLQISSRRPSPAFSLQNLRYALAAADYGSFRRAAEGLLLRQSTLSRCVRQLEESIGMAVFDSTGYHADGSAYERPGRTTAAFSRRAVGEDWVADHTHMSLFRDVPSVSFGAGNSAKAFKE